MYLFEYLLKARTVKLNFQLGIYLLEYLFLVSLVKYAEILWIKQPSRVLPENSHAESVVGSDERCVISVTDKSADTSFHLSRSFVRERHAENISGMDSGGFDKICIAVGQSFGLSRACSRDYADIPLGACDGFYLFVVQFIENIVHDVSLTR